LNQSFDRISGLSEKIKRAAVSEPSMRVSLLTGCQDPAYAYGLAMALISKGLELEVVGSEDMRPKFLKTPGLFFASLRGSKDQRASAVTRLWLTFAYYFRLARYVASRKPRVLHILWNNRFEYFDRTFFMMYYKVLGNKIALTAHNVNQARRDANDSLLNRLTLKIQYHLVDHIFVHTQKMKDELIADFGVREGAVTVIRHPINNAFPDTALSCAEAKQKLGLKEKEKAVLFLGRLRPYKGLEYLLSAFKLLAAEGADYRLIVAGEPKKGSEEYLDQVLRVIAQDFHPQSVILKIEFIPDDQIELYLKAADVMVLPYKEIFQSGILFLGYSFGLPVIATDVGSFGEEIIAGKTGFLCKPGDPVDLAKCIDTYFASDLYQELSVRRRELKEYANANHSWAAVADLTCKAYANI
jgi:D-inositol-3-phosphate glycosyltransferase